MNVFDPTLLDPRSAALRENKEAPLPNEGQARIRRVERLQTELGLIQGFVNDCDRIIHHLKSNDLGLTYPDALNMTISNVEETKVRGAAKGKQVYNELKFLRELK